MIEDAERLIERARENDNLAGIRYQFMSERGLQDLDYVGYLADLELRAMVNDKKRYKLILGRKIFTFDMAYLKQKPSIAAYLMEMEEEQKANPLRFFAPSGNQSTAFLNDFDSDVCILTACNRAGKTQNAVIKTLINTIPCDPTWEIFTEYGVKHREFANPMKVGISSYELGSHKSTLLPMILNWTPTSELGPYAKDYKGKGAKQVNLNNDPTMLLTCGTEIGFYAMTQGQARYESNVVEHWLWDEQGEEAKFDGADERSRTTPSGGRHDFGMTPHKVDGRPDTGAGSWINSMTDGTKSKGHSVSMYHVKVWDVPDWIYPEKSKIKAYEKWVLEPQRLQDDKAEREGQSRFFGMWHESSGLVIDEWNSKIHVIEPFKIPHNWTLYRGVDHGDKHPAAAVFCAMSPEGDLFVFRDYLRKNRVPTQICRDVVELCGNRLKQVGTYRNPRTQNMYDKFEEQMVNEHYQWTVFDARSFSTNSSGEGIPLSKIYRNAGLKMKKGSGRDSDAYVPILKEWFVVNPDKRHFVTGELGAPRIYIFSTCTDLIRTIKRWVWVERKTKSTERLAKESPTKTNDDLCDALKLVIQANPKYLGNPLMSDLKKAEQYEEFEEEQVPQRNYDPITGYY